MFTGDSRNEKKTSLPPVFSRASLDQIEPHRNPSYEPGERRSIKPPKATRDSKGDASLTDISVIKPPAKMLETNHHMSNISESSLGLMDIHKSIRVLE